MLKDELKSHNVGTSYFRKNLPNGRYSTAYGIAYNMDESGIASGFSYLGNNYIVYDGKTLKHYTIDKLQEEFDNQTYSYIRKKSQNPLGVAANYEQRLPGIFENIYEDELEL